MTISPDLSARIVKLIEEYRAKGELASPDLRKLVAQEEVLPVFYDMGGVFTINVDGEIRSFLWDDTSHGEVESDLRIRNLVLFQGSKKYPELEVLIEKPDGARVCAECGGTGIAPFAVELKADNIVCYCGGLRWIP